MNFRSEESVSKEFYNELAAIVGEDYVLQDEPMKKHVTFKVGGPAAFYVKPQSAEQIRELVALHKAEGRPYFLLGKGSNLIVKDEGYQGTVIEVLNGMSDFELIGTHLKADAGIMLGKIASVLLEAGLGGFEFAYGIPGTLGGAVVMNAGAYGGEIKDVIVNATVMDQDGKVFTLDKDQLELGYRTSVIARKHLIVLGAELAFYLDKKEIIEEKMNDFSSRRKEKQPLNFPSAGSTFKRPEGYFAGKLIQDAGLKGYQVGGAMVSEKHSGFVINTGDATCADILQLIADVKRIVFEKFGVMLEEEVKVLG